MNPLDELRRAVDASLDEVPQVRRALADALARYAAHVAIDMTRAQRDSLPEMQGRAAALIQVAEVFLSAPVDMQSAVASGVERRLRRFREVV